MEIPGCLGLGTAESTAARTLIADFLANNPQHSIVVITSGGTRVEVERAGAVRFLDNFSSGQRGARSAVAFLRTNAAVLCIHRKGSKRPFLSELEPGGLEDLGAGEGGNEVVLRIPGAKGLLEEWTSAVKENRLALLQFQSLGEYASLLGLVGELGKSVKGRLILYLAAAVSDFYLPHNQMWEHKIQSSAEPLHLKLEPVPKLLPPLLSSLPDAFVVTFKLETDGEILLDKCRRALQSLQHQVVIGNELEKREKEVWVVRREGEELISLPPNSDSWIEDRIVAKILELRNDA